MRLVFDTNVFISAALKGDFSSDVLKIVANTNFLSLIVSEDILRELNLKLTEKFQWDERAAELFIEAIKDICEIVEIKEKITVIERDPKDNIILECAISGDADLIVSSDQDLLELKKFRRIGIIHPKALMWTFPDYFK